MRLPYILTLLLVISGSVHARHISGQVTEIVDYKTINMTDTGGSRQRVELAGLAELPAGHPLQRQARNRLISLIAGKHIELDTVADDRHRPQLAAVSYGGLDVSSRLLQEGLGITTNDSLAVLPENLQRQYLLAEDQARQQLRGIWSGRQPQQGERYYQPYWLQPGIPSPLLHAPVYTPKR